MSRSDGWFIRPAAEIDLSKIWRQGADNWGDEQAIEIIRILYAHQNLTAWLFEG